MRISVSFAAALLTVALSLYTPTLQAQIVHLGESFDLNDTLHPSKSHEYYANSHISLNPGFHSEPKNHKHTLLQLDPYGIYPPESGLTGGPNPADTGVVGTIGGTVDVGAMGAAIYTIPIELPEGINGMKPNLSIVYNSQAGNGLLGWGWDLAGLSLIERTERTRYHDGAVGAVTINNNTDRYMLDGKRLMLVSDYIDSVEYKTEQDEMSRIRAYIRTEQIGNVWTGHGHTIRIMDHFVVWKANGLVLEYGTTDDSQINLDEPDQNCCWLLHSISDRNGNSIEYQYSKTTTGYELSHIDYTNNSSLSPEFRISFSYGSRLDVGLAFIGCNLLKNDKLLNSITINRRTQNGQYDELGKYSFDYHSVDRQSGYFYTRLDRIRRSQGQECFNPTRVVWPAPDDTYARLYRKEINVTGQQNAFANTIKFPGDFNGDGYTDVIVALKDNTDAYTQAKMYLNNCQDNIVSFSQLLAFPLNENISWIYVADYNGDGKDDYAIIDRWNSFWPWRDLVTVDVYLSAVSTTGAIYFRHLPQMGPYRINRDAIESVLIGDFLGIGRDGIVIQTLLDDSKDGERYELEKAYYLECSQDETYVTQNEIEDYLPSLRIMTADFNGDGAAELLSLTEDGCQIHKLSHEGNGFFYSLIAYSSVINGSYDCYLGDFNGDGKTDVLSCHQNSNNASFWQINLFGGENFAGPTYTIESFGLGFLGINHFYTLQSPLYVPYFVQVADFNGDGYDDIRHPEYGDVYDQQYYFGPLVESGQYAPFSGKKLYHIYTRPHINKETCLGSFRGTVVCDDLGDDDVFHLALSMNRYNINEIVDGLNNKTEFGFDYVLQSSRDLGYGTRVPSVPVKTLVTVSSFNTSGKRMTDSLAFADPCYHRDGHGWLGFKKQTRKSFEDGTETSRTVSTKSLGAMTTHAMLLPEADTVYVFPHGTKVLSSVTTYGFEKVRSNLNHNRLVTCPALIRKDVVKYDPDNPNTILSKAFIENHFNYSDGLYDETYHCDSTRTGVDDATGIDFSSCENRTVETNTYYPDNYGTWTINRPHCQKQVQSKRGKPDVEKSLWYNYVSGNSYAVSRVCELPSVGFIQSPFLVQTDFEYYPNGNLKKKTVKVPYGQRDEQQKNYEYEYGPGDQQRLVTKETVSSGGLSYATSYTYDDYDRIDTLTGANGLATTFDNDALGITSWTQNADGTRTCIVQRWASGHPLKPQGALYYTWERSSEGKQNLVFYHKTGTELRSVAYGIHGEPIITDKRYDHRGRLSAVSNPYKESETPRWTIYGYDNLDRLTTLSTPDTTVTSIVHVGFRTETTVTTPQGLAQESAAVVNAMGWTVRSEDASGSYLVFDHYADGLVATVTIDENPSTTVTAVYDDARHRTSLTDPDYGILATRYDAYGRLTSSTTPRESAGQTQTEYVYDGFDRVVLVADGLDGTVARYSYNESGVAKGTLEEVLFREAEGANIQVVTYGYDNLARPITVTEQRADGTYTTTMEYNGQSQVSRQVYPSGFAVRYDYRRGRLRKITDDENHLLWKTNDIDASGRLLEAELGNGAVTRYAYDTVMRRLESIVTTNNLQNLSYSYDKFGNLAARKDNIRNLEETFEYDSQNRLTEIRLGPTLTGASVYDSYGRMTTKIADGIPVFFDATFSVAKPHAMDGATTSSGVFPDDPQTITYTSFDKVREIKQGTDSLCYTYGYDRQRIFMEEHVGITSRTKRYIGNCEYITKNNGNVTDTQWLTYLTGPTGVYAVVMTKNGSDQIFYVLKDNLGSWTTITDENGEVVQELSYDAWGNLRNPSTWANYTVNDTYEKPLFDRGYTGHEHLSSFGLVNMNGRMYDPLMSAFLSPDRYVQDPMSAQGFNRYAYCLYNPLRYIDPSGWLAGSGGPSYPINTVTIEGQLYIVLPEFTVTSTPILDNEFVYTPYYGGSRGDQWDFDNSRPSQDGGGAGGGNHGGSSKNTTPDPNINIEIASKLLTSANVYTSIESSLYFNRLTRTWRDKMDIFRSFDFNGNGSTGGKISYGKLMSNKYTNTGRIIGSLGVFISVNQCINATSVDSQLEYGFDAFIGFSGVVAPEFLGFVSTIWFLGGKQITFWYGKTTIIPMMNNGINPGQMEYQPFK